MSDTRHAVASTSVRSALVEVRGSSLSGSLLEQRYRVDGLLARGGMSAVYRGLDTRLDRPVAIKVMDSRFVADASFVDRFEREARSAAKIHHPNVVAVHDQGVDGENVYLVMELVDGGTLRDLLANGPLPVELACSVLEPVLAALGAAHRAGLVHRDVKPENVLIGHTSSGGSVVKVGDFGLVRAVSSAGMTHSSVILGTVAYLSPEQVTTGAATARGDVYSAGIVLYEMLTGRPPYTGDTALSVAYQHVNDDVPAPSSLVATIPAALDDLVLRATRRDPSARPMDADTFLAELRQVCAALAIQSAPVPVPVPVNERTMPVSAAVTGSDRESIKGDLAVAGAVAANGTATVLSPPTGNQVGIGPQGTRTMLRSQFDALTEQTPPAPPPHTPPHGGYPPTGGQPVMEPPPRRRTWRIVLIAALVVLLAGGGGTTLWWFTSGRYSVVPAVSGLTQAAAEQKLHDVHLTPRIKKMQDNKVPKGTVIRTEPAGGRLLRGDPVTLVISLGRPMVPAVNAGAAPGDVDAAIRAAGLVPRKDPTHDEYSDTVPAGKLVRVDPPPGTELDMGADVTMILSKGPQPKPVPDVTGHPHDEAFAMLQQAGYQPYDLPAEFSPDVDAGNVIRTDPAANSTPNGGDLRVGVVVSNAITIPSLSGQLVTDVLPPLQQAQLSVQVINASGAPNPQSRVYTQSIAPGTRVQPGTALVLTAFP